jgi:hypothetical protein
VRKNNSAYTGPFIKDMETMAIDLANWAADYVEDVIETLMPDKRAWQEVLPTPNEQLMQYLDMRGNNEAWRKWIELKVMEMRQLLADSGLEEETIATLGVYDIVEPMAIAYSVAHEQLLDKLGTRQPLDEDEEVPLLEEASVGELPV